MNTEIEQTLVAQNPHWESVAYQHQFKRLHTQKGIADLSMQEIQIITGIRRAGKSTLIESMINHLMQHYAPRSILYVNLDDPNYTPLCDDAKAFYDIITITEKLTQQKVDFIFLDEIQNIAAWEKYIKSVYDSKQFKKIVISGSNGNLLNSDYATLLSGRYIKTHIYPLSYQELLLHHKINDPLILVQKKATALSLVDSLMSMGGFPRIHCIDHHEQQLQLLKNYYETILLKDCIANHNVRDAVSFSKLSNYLINTVSSLYSYNSLYKILGGNENTIQQYVNILENAYFIHQLQQYSYSHKTQSRSKKKAYCIDNGLITAVTFQFSNNFGKLLENLVYTELKKKQFEHIYFHHDVRECDFIVHDQKNAFAVQVCYALTPENQKRELQGIQQAMEKFRLQKGIIITYDDEIQFEKNIQAIPFWKFFASQ